MGQSSECEGPSVDCVTFVPAPDQSLEPHLRRHRTTVSRLYLRGARAMKIGLENTRDTLRSFILKEFLPGEKPEELTDSTPLITGGVLDSLATLKLVSFLEERYNIQLEAHEVDVEH